MLILSEILVIDIPQVRVSCGDDGIIAGTNRPGSNTLKVAKKVEAAYRALKVPAELLQTSFGYRNAYLYPERVFLPRIHEVLDGAGEFKDAALAERWAAQAAGFADFVRRIGGN